MWRSCLSRLLPICLTSGSAILAWQKTCTNLSKNQNLIQNNIVRLTPCQLLTLKTALNVDLQFSNNINKLSPIQYSSMTTSRLSLNISRLVPLKSRFWILKYQRNFMSLLYVQEQIASNDLEGKWKGFPKSDVQCRNSNDR